MRRGFPVVLSAASGTGKTTLSQLVLESDRDLRLSVSYTTRSPRGEEKNGIHYHFVDDATFIAMIDRGAFIEHADVHGARYGSSREWTAEQMKDGHDVLFDIDVQGGRQLKAIFPEAVLIFLMPPSMAELERRLRDRKDTADDVIQRRLKAAPIEIAAGLDGYDYLVLNERMETALADLTAILRTHRLRSVDRAALKRSLLGG